MRTTLTLLPKFVLTITMDTPKSAPQNNSDFQDYQSRVLHLYTTIVMGNRPDALPNTYSPQSCCQKTEDHAGRPCPQKAHDLINTPPLRRHPLSRIKYAISKQESGSQEVQNVQQMKRLREENHREKCLRCDLRYRRRAIKKQKRVSKHKVNEKAAAGQLRNKVTRHVKIKTKAGARSEKHRGSANVLPSAQQTANGRVTQSNLDIPTKQRESATKDTTEAPKSERRLMEKERSERQSGLHVLKHWASSKKSQKHSFSAPDAHETTPENHTQPTNDFLKKGEKRAANESEDQRITKAEHRAEPGKKGRHRAAVYAVFRASQQAAQESPDFGPTGSRRENQESPMDPPILLPPSSF